MIYYKKADGTSDLIDDDKCDCHVWPTKNHTFTIERTSYGWDEYDYYIDTIENVVEIRIEQNQSQ